MGYVDEIELEVVLRCNNTEGEPVGALVKELSSQPASSLLRCKYV